MQAKKFNLELFRLHPNRGHGTPESALGNSSPGRPMFHKTELKETERNNGRLSHNSPKPRVT